MEGCTEDRSLTPPLPKNLVASHFGENGKQIISSLYDKDDQIDINRSIPMSSIANKLGLCNYNSTSEDEDDEVKNESNSKSTSDRGDSTKSTVIKDAKNRRSGERDRKNRRDRRGSRESSPRKDRKFDRKQRRSTSKHRNNDYHNRRRRSSSKGKTRFQSPKDILKEPPKPRGEIRRTVAEPIIEYCDNGRYPSIKRCDIEPKSKSRRINDTAERVLKTSRENNEDKLQALANDAKNEGSTTPKVNPFDVNAKIIATELEISLNAHNNKSNEVRSMSPHQKPEIKPLQQPIKSEVDIKVEKFSIEEEIPSNVELAKIEPKPEIQPANSFDLKSSEKEEPQSETKTDTDIKTKISTPEHSKWNVKPQQDETKALSEDKLKQYIDEYEFFIQQVSSPLVVADTNRQPDEPSIKNSPNVDMFSTSSPKISSKKSPTPSLSSSSSSSSDDDSSSSSSSSSSDDDSDSSSDSSSSSNSDKSASDSSSSRSNTKSPRPLKSVNSNCESNRLNFPIGDIKPSNADPLAFLTTPFSLPKSNINISALKSLDDLINFDDDDDLMNSLQSYKNQLKSAKEKSKLDGATSNDIQSGDTSNKLENGALLQESERKKISLKLKTTTTLKSQSNELNDPSNEQEQPDSDKPTANDKPITEQNDQQTNDKGSKEKSMTAKKKSSYRKDERKSHRSEDRKSRNSEERSRSKRSEDRRSLRSEDKHSKRSEERRTKRSEERHSRRSEDRRSRRSEEKRHRRSEERRQKRRRQSPVSPMHYRDSYYSPQYRNRSMSPLPRGPRTPPNTPPPNQTEFDEMAMRHMPYSTPIMPPSAHYQRDPNQYSTPNLPSNVPNYVNEYAAYMHPNRISVPTYNRPPPGIHTSPGMPNLGPNNEYYYQNSPSHVPPSHHLSNQSIPSNSFSNLIEVAPYGVPNTNIDSTRKPLDNRRKPTIAVQKGNVLEIVPSADILCDKNIDPMDTDKSDKVHLIEKQHQQAMQRQRQERIKRKMERDQKRSDRRKRKEFLMAELNRLSHLMIFGEDGKIIKAGEILKSIVYDGSNIKLANAKEIDDDEETEEIFTEPVIYSYDPQAAVGKGILSDRNEVDKLTTATKDSNTPNRRGVLFADGVAPGDGTSASENSEAEDDDTIIKPKKLSTRAKNKKEQTNNITLPPIPNEATMPLFLEKENLMETKFNPRECDQQQMIPPPPPGSPPLQLPQPVLRNPEKFIMNRYLYFHYDARFNKMIITETPPHMMPQMMMMQQPPQLMKANHVMQPMEPNQPAPPYMFKANNIRHHTDTKSTKPKSSSSKPYHSSTHKSLHPNNDTNLIVLSNSPNV